MSIRNDVSAAELDRHLCAVSAEVRLSGTPEGARAFDYIQGELQRFGYNVQRFESEALIGYPAAASLQGKLKTVVAWGCSACASGPCSSAAAWRSAASPAAVPLSASRSQRRSLTARTRYEAAGQTDGHALRATGEA